MPQRTNYLVLPIMSAKHLLLVIVSLTFVANSIPMPLANGLAKGTDARLSKELFATSNFSTALGCNGHRFGRDLNLRSCLEAYDYIPKGMTQELSFGERDEGRSYDIELPKRYLSCKSLYKQTSSLTSAKSFLSRWDLCHRARIEETTDVSTSTTSWLNTARSFGTIFSLYHPILRYCRLLISFDPFRLRRPGS